MDTGAWLRIGGCLVAAYLLGGIPWALVIGKSFYHLDVRTVGSGNLGATNVMRALGPVAGVATLLLDAAKGALSVTVAWWVVPAAGFGDSAHEWAMIGATLAAIVGHSYSPYLRLKGGKGVAAAAGALLVLTPQAWPLLLGTWIVVVAVSRLVSLGSVVIAVEYPLLCLWLYRGDWPVVGFAFGAAALVIWRHRTNIARIVRGQETKVSFGGKSSAGRGEDGS